MKALAAMVVHVAKTAAMELHAATVNLKATIAATTVAMVDLVAITVLVDTALSVVHLAMTTENLKSTELMMLLKSSEIMVKTMASANRRWRLPTHPEQWRTHLPELSAPLLSAAANHVEMASIEPAKVSWIKLSAVTRETSLRRLRVWLMTSRKRWASPLADNWVPLDRSAKLVPPASLALKWPSPTTSPTLRKPWARWVSESTCSKAISENEGEWV